MSDLTQNLKLPNPSDSMCFFCYSGLLFQTSPTSSPPIHKKSCRARAATIVYIFSSCYDRFLPHDAAVVLCVATLYTFCDHNLSLHHFALDHHGLFVKNDVEALSSGTCHDKSLAVAARNVLKRHRHRSRLPLPSFGRGLGGGYLHSLSLSLSIYLSIYLSFFLSFLPSVSLSLSLSLSVCLSVGLSVCLSVCPSVRLSVRLSIYLYIYLSIYLSISLSLSLARAG